MAKAVKKPRTKKAQSKARPPEHPTVEGRYRMTKEWSLTLPGSFKRRFEDDALVLWRPGITLWIVVWGNDTREPREDRLKWLQSETSEKALSAKTSRGADVTRYSYRLTEKHDGAKVHALYAFAIADQGHVQLAIYLDNETDFDQAQAIWKSVSLNRQEKSG